MRVSYLDARHQASPLCENKRELFSSACHSVGASEQTSTRRMSNEKKMFHQKEAAKQEEYKKSKINYLMPVTSS